MTIEGPWLLVLLLAMGGLIIAAYKLGQATRELDCLTGRCRLAREIEDTSW